MSDDLIIPEEIYQIDDLVKALSSGHADPIYKELSLLGYLICWKALAFGMPRDVLLTGLVDAWEQVEALPSISLAEMEKQRKRHQT